MKAKVSRINIMKSASIVNEICQQVGLVCSRGDEEHVRGDILPHILRLLVRSSLVIANIDGRNPNVLYELGIAHAIGKPTILISKSNIDLSFDIKSKSIILYEDDKELKDELEVALTRVLVKE